MQRKYFRKWLAVNACMLFLVMGCSENRGLEDGAAEGAVSENVISEDTVSEYAGNEMQDAGVETPSEENDAQGGEAGQEYAVLVAWEDAGMEDHVMDWKDENLQIAMEAITGITGRDIMLSDV